MAETSSLTALTMYTEAPPIGAVSTNELPVHLSLNLDVLLSLPSSLLYIYEMLFTCDKSRSDLGELGLDGSSSAVDIVPEDCCIGRGCPGESVIIK